ncbi:MAG: hypothetical protein ACRDQ1_05265, partial [Sciscionella sp.]
STIAKNKKTSTYPDAYAEVYADVVSQASQVNLLRLRDAAGNSLCYVYVNTKGKLGVHNDTTGKNTVSSVVFGSGWHSVQVRLSADATQGTTTGILQVWLDGTLVAALSSTSVDVGSASVGAIQVGDTQTGRTYDVVFDDAAFGTTRLGAP